MLYEIGEWWATLLDEGDRTFVRTFVPTLDVQVTDGPLMYCFHGSPLSFSDWIFSTTPDDELERMLGGADAPILVGGHTHLQLVRRYGPAVLVNPGSVGQPFARWWPKPIRVAPWGEYGIIDASPGRLDIELRRVPFDVQALLDFCAASGMPHAQWWIDSWNAD
jgi:diadenosine tetraphosphatase ApaH/serine/threonine PP2A family protein phosphatase